MLRKKYFSRWPKVGRSCPGTSKNGKKDKNNYRTVSISSNVPWTMKDIWKNILNLFYHNFNATLHKGVVHNIALKQAEKLGTMRLYLPQFSKIYQRDLAVYLILD